MIEFIVGVIVLLLLCTPVYKSLRRDFAPKLEAAILSILIVVFFIMVTPLVLLLVYTVGYGLLELLGGIL